MHIATPSKASQPLQEAKKVGVIVGAIAAPQSTRTTPRCHTMG